MSLPSFIGGGGKLCLLVNFLPASYDISNIFLRLKYRLKTLEGVLEQPNSRILPEDPNFQVTLCKCINITTNYGTHVYIYQVNCCHNESKKALHMLQRLHKACQTGSQQYERVYAAWHKFTPLSNIKIDQTHRINLALALM